MSASQGISSYGNSTVPAATSAVVPNVSSSQGLGSSATTSNPLFYAGVSFHTDTFLTGAILVAFATLYVAIWSISNQYLFLVVISDPRHHFDLNAIKPQPYTTTRNNSLQQVFFDASRMICMWLLCCGL